MTSRAALVALTVALASPAFAEEGASCPRGLPPLGSARAKPAPVLDAALDPLDALKSWRDELLGAYRACELAPFEAEKLEPGDKGNAFSHELGRGVGAYRVKPDATITAELGRALDILDVELAGNVTGGREALAPLRFLAAWPIKNGGEVVTGCRVEVTQGRRAELCLDDIDDVDRAAPSAITTQLRLVVICPPPLVAEEVAMVYLAPAAPAPHPPVIVERAPQYVPTFLAAFSRTETATRELTCNEGRSWCLGLTASGGFSLTQGPEQRLAGVEAQDLDGFSIAAPGRWTGIEHTPSGLRIGRSAIGSYYGLPTGGHTRYWLSSDACMVWKRKTVGPKRYPARVELGSLCQIDGIWVEGMQTVAPLRGEPRQVVQTRYLDDTASRCRYIQ